MKISTNPENGKTYFNLGSNGQSRLSLGNSHTSQCKTLKQQHKSVPYKDSVDNQRFENSVTIRPTPSCT
jgi:hypothetical protein